MKTLQCDDALADMITYQAGKEQITVPQLLTRMYGLYSLEWRDRDEIIKGKEELERVVQEFRNEIYGDNDALFDRAGNNVSTQVENCVRTALTSYANSRIQEFVREVEGIRSDLEQIQKLVNEKDLMGLAISFPVTHMKILDALSQKYISKDKTDEV